MLLKVPKGENISPWGLFYVFTGDMDAHYEPENVNLIVLKMSLLNDRLAMTPSASLPMMSLRLQVQQGLGFYTVFPCLGYELSC